jgi:hypothetical protein
MLTFEVGFGKDRAIFLNKSRWCGLLARMVNFAAIIELKESGVSP